MLLVLVLLVLACFAPAFLIVTGNAHLLRFF
jgi:hypothetical protein